MAAHLFSPITAGWLIPSRYLHGFAVRVNAFGGLIVGTAGGLSEAP
jgi:hypothetical protein